jgi:hypothetical protein
MPYCATVLAGLAGGSLAPEKEGHLEGQKEPSRNSACLAKEDRGSLSSQVTRMLHEVRSRLTVQRQLQGKKLGCRHQGQEVGS